MQRNATITDSLAARADKVLVGRQSNLRAVPEPSIFLAHGDGQRYTDVDGNVYIDFAISMGPGIWGHGASPYLDAVKAQLDRMYYIQSGNAQSALEVELAERINAHVPSAEWCRFMLSGSETVQMAIRIARAYTGRPRFVRFAGHYHGWMDNVLGGIPNPDPSAPPHALDRAGDPMRTLGRSPYAFQESYMVQWNDLDALEALLAERGAEIALVMMEVVNSNGGGCRPKPGYLEGVRALCDRYGVVLHFDEIITGFRVGLSGAQGVYGVTPDLTTFGKAIGGGMPMAAIVGKKKVMDPMRRNEVIAAGTFNGFPPALAGAIATIDILRRDGDELYGRVDRLQARMEQGLVDLARRYGHPAITQGCRGVFTFLFTERPAIWCAAEFAHVDTQKALRWRALAREEGILQGQGGRHLISFAMTDADVDDALVKYEAVFRQL